MLVYLVPVEALLFYHRHTGNFLGMEKAKDFQYNWVVPVNDVKEALDFKLSEGGVSPHPNYHTTTSERTLEEPTSDVVRILHPTQNLSFDSHTGKGNDGDSLILYPSHNKQAQMFYLKMLSDLTFVIAYQDKCMKYNSKRNNFRLSSCKNLGESKFDLYHNGKNNARKPIVQRVYNTDEESSEEKNQMFYKEGSDPFLKGFEDKNVTKIHFKGNKAIETGPQSDHIKYAVHEVNVQPMVIETSSRKKEVEYEPENFQKITKPVKVTKHESYYTEETVSEEAIDDDIQNEYHGSYSSHRAPTYKSKKAHAFI